MMHRKRQPALARPGLREASAPDEPASGLGLEPASVAVGGSWLRAGDDYTATLAVTGWPSEVGMGWLETLLQWQPTPSADPADTTASSGAGGARLDVAVHIDPLPAVSAAARVRKQRARLESARRMDAGKGRLDDPLIEAAAADAADLADLVARGESRLFSVGVYLTVHAPARQALYRSVAEVRAAAASVMLDTQPATWRQLSGWCSTLPLGHDGLGMRRIMDTAALAASFPLATQDLPAPLPGDDDAVAGGGGVLFGITNAGVLWWDRWAQDNHNSVVLARSGAGKSYLVKLDVLRNLYAGVRVHVIDPEDEYTRLARATGGTLIRLGAPGVRINPLDLLPIGLPVDQEPHAAASILPEDALTRRALFVHTLVGVLAGEAISPGERAALDRAIIAAYATAEITHDPATWHRPAPLLRDVVTALNNGTGKNGDGTVLADRLEPWVSGSFRHLFDGPTSTSEDPPGPETSAGPDRPVAGRHLVVWSTRHLSDELRAAGMLLALDATWRDIDQTGITPHRTRPAGPRGGISGALPSGELPNGLGNPLGNVDGALRQLVVVDEAWSLMREPDGARFLARMAKSARKRNAGLAVVTQDAADLLGSQLGQVVVANSATQILMRQAPQAIAAVAQTFGLSPGEAQLLLGAQRGQALLLGSARVAFTSIGSAWEHELASGWNDLPNEDPAVHDDLGDDESSNTDGYRSAPGRPGSSPDGGTRWT